MPEQLSRAALRLLAVEIAARLPGFRMEREKDDDNHVTTLLHEDGRAINISAPSYPHSDRGKLAISGYFTREQREQRSYDDTEQRIMVSASRGAVVIAKEIARRLLPEYTAMWEKRVQRVAEATKYANQSLNNACLIAQALGEKRPEKDSFRFFQGEVYGDVQVSGMSIKIEARCLTLEQALAIAKIIGKKA